jgi:hypothetical protein
VTGAQPYGLSRHQLEYHWQWMMRQAPADPAKLPEFLGRCVITLIEKNNAALARAAAEDARADLPERG